MNRKRRGIGGLTAVAVSGATILGGLFATSGSAFAAVPNAASSDWAASSAPNVYPGATNQAAGDWTFTLTNDFTSQGTLVVNIGPPSAGTDQCQTGTDYVGLASTPTVTFTAAAGNSSSDTAPQINVSTATNSTDGASCKAAGVKDQLVLTFQNDATGTAGDTYTVTVSGVQYNVGVATPAAAGGSPILAEGFDTAGVTGATTYDFNVASNATVQPVSLVGNQPPVGIVAGTTKGISPLVLAEHLPAQVSGTVTVTLDQDSLAASPVTITATNALITNGSAGATPGTSTTVTPTAGSSSFTFVVTTGSTVTPATFTISGITVNAAAGNAGPADVTVTYDPSGDQATTVAYAVIGMNRTAGYTVDDTAAQSFQSGTTNGFGPGGTINRYSNGLLGSCAQLGAYSGNGYGYAVLASDITPYDALSANYLAGFYNTGVLLTPQNSLDANVANVIRQDGIGTVFIIGGTAAVSQAVETALDNTPAYCWNNGSSVPAGSNVKVIRIAGTTADETASDVAQYNGPSGMYNGEPGTPGAYGTTMYNDTTGTGSSTGPTGAGNAPNGYRTAIVATDITFQDALSSGPMSYSDGVPVILTSQSGLSTAAAAALVNLGIEQVYIIGGPAAVSNQVTTDIQNLGIPVLRIAGLTYSDTAQLLAQFEINSSVNKAGQSLGLDVFYGNSNGAVGSARGDSYGDALTSAASLYNNEPNGDFDPLLLTQDTNTVGSATDSFLKQAGNTTGAVPGIDGVNTFELHVFGGTLAQTPSLVQQEINDLANG